MCWSVVAGFKGADVVVCAMPDQAASEPIEAVARQCGVELFRGAESDVLSRYLGAAKSVGADIVMRVTSDCPLIDPEVCGALLVLRHREHADYAANNMPYSFPQGLDCEAVTRVALEEADQMTDIPYDREHATPWLCRAPHIRRANLSSSRPELGRLRWTSHYPEDLEFCRAVLASFADGSRANLNDILAVLAKHPEIAKINECRRQVTVPPVQAT